MSDLNEFLKKAFEYKNNGEYKKAIDFFYKALALDNKSCEIMFELAQMYSKLCKYDRALSFYEQILTADKDNLTAKFYTAVIYKKTNNIEEAKKILEGLSQTNFDKKKTAEELFSIYLEQNNYDEIINKFHKNFAMLNSASILYYTALAYDKTGQKTQAEEYYNKSFTLEPQNVNTGIQIAEELFEKNNIKEAEELVFKLLKYSECDSLLYLAGEIYYAKGDLDSAAKYYSYAVKQNNKNAKYYFKLGIVFSLKGFFDEAETCYCKATVLDCDNITYNYALAYLYYTGNKIKLASKVLEFIFSVDEDNTDANSLMILINLKENNIVDAGKLVAKTSRNTEVNDFLYYAHSLYYAQLNMWEKSIKSILQAIAFNENSIDYKYVLAQNYYNLSNFKKAEEICTLIIEKSPKYIQGYILLAKIKVALGEDEAAENLLNSAMKLDTNLPEVYELSGEINYRNKDYQKALENYKTAVSINPNREDYIENTAKCYYQLENYECAYLYYKEAAEFDITNAKYRFYMAKCSVKTNNQDGALANFSVMKRLEPYNIDYIKEYALYLKEINGEKSAETMIKNLIKHTSKEQKQDLKNFIKLLGK